MRELKDCVEQAKPCCHRKGGRAAAAKPRWLACMPGEERHPCMNHPWRLSWWLLCHCLQVRRYVQRMPGEDQFQSQEP